MVGVIEFSEKRGGHYIFRESSIYTFNIQMR